MIPGSGRSPGEGIGYPLQDSWASLIAQLVKNPPAMRETWVQSLGWEDSPGEGKGCPFQYSGLENSIDCIVHGVAKSWTQLSDFHFTNQGNGAVVKNLPSKAGDSRDTVLIPGSGRSPGIGNGNPLQYSCLGNSMYKEVWLATVHEVTKSWTQLSD